MEKIIKLLMGDKAVHFLYSFLLTVLLCTIMPIVWSIAITIAIGLIKECLDKRSTGFNEYDLVANWFGITLGAVVCSYLINYM